MNFTEYSFSRTYPSTLDAERKLEPFFYPRIALLNKITPGISLYTSLSQGFSPPSIAELYPSRGIFDQTIQAEQGTNFEIGVRGEGPKRINFDITAYYFRLQDALVIRRDTTLQGDPEYFVNAGETSQKGVEALVSLHLIQNKSTIISDLKIWNSYAYQNYRFENYVQNENDYSGKKLTGISPGINTSGLDMVLLRKYYLNLTANYVDHTPLDDANTAFASEYFLLGARAGYKGAISSVCAAEIFAGVDNALDKKYSLGNDLNAVGGRYYNAAPGINFYVGLKFTVLPKQ
jgi:iron complex outermembrane recepter protein